MSAEDQEETTIDDVKAKMKAALDRKHATEHPGQDHLDKHGKADHTHGKSGGQERFQRKSG